MTERFSTRIPITRPFGDLVERSNAASLCRVPVFTDAGPEVSGYWSQGFETRERDVRKTARDAGAVLNAT